MNSILFSIIYIAAIYYNYNEFIMMINISLEPQDFSDSNKDLNVLSIILILCIIVYLEKTTIQVSYIKHSNVQLSQIIGILPEESE